ncbi:WD40 repeat domain-containing protein [Gemmata sp. JC673]|uniref:WD40 repeat domain-containing protein n=1 Tax=Gemmata algarum TaxID=2975278 RepID=A0ABU5F4W4_9BACT|nr:WD40 repeat domain-containing protein [Gemmata algarum]MDY3560936.1 WD40 repeat domain-containing protein [Gemmata algarum]
MLVLKTASAEVLDLAFSPDSRAIAAAVDGAHVFLWNLDSPNIAPVRLGLGGKYRAGGLRFSATGRRLEWQLADGCRAYDRDERDATNEYPSFLTKATVWKVGPAGDRIVSSHGMPDHFLAGWQFKDGEWVRQWALSTLHLSVESVTISPAGDRFAMLTRPASPGRWWDQPMRLEVRDLPTSASRSDGTYPYSYAGKLWFSPTGAAVVGIHGMTLLSWSLPAGGGPRLARNDNRKHFTALAYHPNGRRLFVTSNDETVNEFDADTLERTNRYTWQLDRLSAIAVSPDGTLAAAGAATGDVVVWDLE